MKNLVKILVLILATDVWASESGEDYGQRKCRGLATLSMANDNLIGSKAEWDTFVKGNPLFVVGGADSTCERCCESEPLLHDLQQELQGKAKFSYPQKHKKQKKIVRKEIKVARVDLNNKDLTQKLGGEGIWFPMGTTILLVIEGRAFKYEGFDEVISVIHHLQRLANPLVSLTSEEQIMSFLDTSEPKIWHEDYHGMLCAKGQSFDEDHLMELQLADYGYQTRVVAFFFDKDDFKDEIAMLKHSSQHLALRYNLRIGMVTDKKLITKMKKSHPEIFLDVGMSVMVLRRYDGTLSMLNLADVEADRYVWWITTKSIKGVEQVSSAVSEIAELSHMRIITLFVDFSEPEVSEKSTMLIKNMEKLAPEFIENYVITWTDDEWYMKQRRTLGITWDELPSIGMNSFEHIIYAYPRGQPFDVPSLRAWFNKISLK